MTNIGGLDVPTMVATSAGVRVRRPGPDPSREGTRERYLASGTVTTESVPMSGLVELFGVAVAAKLPNGAEAGSACSLQVSVDGGATYLAWDGAGWSTQLEDEVFNSQEEFNEHSSTIPFVNPRSIGFRMRMTTDGRETATATHLSAYVEWSYTPMVDFYQFMSDVADRIRVPLRVQIYIPTASDSVQVQTEFTLDATRPIRVFNVQADPLRNTDLFDSVLGNVVTMTAQQPDASWVEVQFLGSAETFVAHQDEMLTITKVPSTIVRVWEAREIPGNTAHLQFDYKIGTTTRRTRVRRHAELVRIPVEIKVVVAEPRAALEALEAIRDALRAETLRSPASGGLITIVEDAPGVSTPNLNEGVDVARWSGSAILQLPARQYEEFAAAEPVRISLSCDKLPT